MQELGLSKDQIGLCSQTQALGRYEFQIDVAELPQKKMLRAIKLLGGKVTPTVRGKTGVSL
jgi:hypothetical protein